MKKIVLPALAATIIAGGTAAASAAQPQLAIESSNPAATNVDYKSYLTAAKTVKIDIEINARAPMDATSLDK